MKINIAKFIPVISSIFIRDRAPFLLKPFLSSEFFKVSEFHTSVHLEKAAELDALPFVEIMDVVKNTSLVLSDASVDVPSLDCSVIIENLVDVSDVSSKLMAAIDDDKTDWTKINTMLAIPGAAAILDSKYHYELYNLALEEEPTKALDEIKYLVSRSVNVNASRAENTVIYNAAGTTKEIVKFLLDNGANPDVKSCVGDTPYALAARNAVFGDQDALSILKLLFDIRKPSDEECRKVEDWFMQAPWLEDELHALMGDDIFDAVSTEA